MAQKRVLVLMYLEFDIFFSPSPLLFTRPSSMQLKDSYFDSDCIILRLQSKIGHGATGDAYRGLLELPTRNDGTAHSVQDVVIKLTTKKAEALLHEYSIYRHLAQRMPDLDGIPRCLGLFESHESGHSALVLGHSGHPIGYRGDSWKASAAER